MHLIRMRREMTTCTLVSRHRRAGGSSSSRMLDERRKAPRETSAADSSNRCDSGFRARKRRLLGRLLVGKHGNLNAIKFTVQTCIENTASVNALHGQSNRRRHSSAYHRLQLQIHWAHKYGFQIGRRLSLDSSEDGSAFADQNPLLKHRES